MQRTGWTAFDLKQRQRNGHETDISEDPFPPISSGVITADTQEKLSEDPIKSFSSVLISPIKFPTLTAKKNSKVAGPNFRISPNNVIVKNNNHDAAFKQLKENHGWIEDCVIEDILVATDDNVEMASAFLKGMVFTDSPEENNGKTAEDSSSYQGNGNRYQKTASENAACTSSRKFACFPNMDTLEDKLQPCNEEALHANATGNTKLFDHDSDLKKSIEHLRSIPLEPEWEEDDVYLSHRRDALKMMRSAAHHAKAASSAFLRGDHLSAKHHSLQAREYWSVAERLNSEAAKLILNIRNSNNDIWKLDLHGLHAAEAIQALQERLKKIEDRAATVNQSVSPNRIKISNGMVRASSQESLGSIHIGNVDSRRTSSRNRQTSLQIITGVGNHSRGQASLPIAVRSFLEDNGYRFDETRPGVITVKPKFRRR